EDDGTSPTASFVTAEGGLKALVSDPALTSGRPGDGANPLFVQQRLLAETALLAMGGGSPEELRRVIAAFPRDWNPTPADEKLFELVESTSWLRPVSASAVLSHFPTAYGGPITYPKRERAAELGDRLIEDLRELSGTAETYLDMLAEEQDNRVELERAFLRGTSMSWRGSQARAARLVGAMRTDTAAKMSRVLLTAPALVTLSSDTGPFPLTITNGSRDEPGRHRAVPAHDPVGEAGRGDRGPGRAHPQRPERAGHRADRADPDRPGSEEHRQRHGSRAHRTSTRGHRTPGHPERHADPRD